jgi:hypothetical protein
MDLILEVVLKCCLLFVISIYIRCHYGSLQSLLLVIGSVKNTRDVGHKNGIRATLYFGEVWGGSGLGVESGVNAIILLEGSQASPNRSSDLISTKNS